MLAGHSCMLEKNLLAKRRTLELSRWTLDNWTNPTSVMRMSMPYSAHQRQRPNQKSRLEFDNERKKKLQPSNSSPAPTENTHAAQTAFVFLHLQVFCHSNIVQSDFSICLLLSGLCFVFLAQTFLDSVGAVLPPCVLRRQFSERGSCVHTTLIHCAPQTLCDFVVTEDIHLFTVYEPSTKSMNRRNILMRNGQATPISLGISQEV